MAQYPVADEAGIIEGVNYLLSGPTGLGQNFDGFNSLTPAYLTSYFRAPFTLPKQSSNIPKTLWYSAPINIGNITAIDSRTFEVTFATTQPTPPYSIGQGLLIDGVNPNIGGIVSDGFIPTGTKVLTTEELIFDSVIPTTVTGTGSGAVVEIVLEASASEPYDITGDPFNLTVNYINRGTGYSPGDILLIPGNLIGGTSPANDLTLEVDEVTNVYNGYWTPPGVVTCSTTSVVIQANSDYDFPAYVEGGTIQLEATGAYVSTDANGRVQVYGPSDKVFVSAQIALDWNYISDADGSQDIRVAIRRFAGFLDTSDPLNKDYLFADPTTITEQRKTIAVVSGTGSITDQQFVFSTVIDSPSFIEDGVIQGYGYYWYILEVYFVRRNRRAGDAIVYPTNVTVNLRSLTAQVIKQ
jgi:hypothetical protein